MDISDKNNEMTPYEKTINGETMTLKELTEHLDNIADNGESMSYDEFKKRLEYINPQSEFENPK